MFSSSDAASAGLYVKDLKAGSQQKLLLKLSASNAIARSWSADGRFILLEQRPGSGNSDLAAVPVTEPDRPVAVADSPFNEQFGDFSPNGRWIAYNSDESGRSEIYVQSFPGRDVRVQVTADGGFEPRWSSDGGTLVLHQSRQQADERSGDALGKAGDRNRGGLVPHSESGLRLDESVSGVPRRPEISDFSATGLETPTTTVTVNWAAALK